MAWAPRQSRSSISRREQNRALIGYIITGLVILAGVLLLLFSRVQPNQTKAVRGAALDLVAPVWSVVRMPFEAVARAGDYVSDYFGAIGRNRELEAEHVRLRAVEERYKALQFETNRLKQMLNVIEPTPRRIAVARIAGASSASYVRSAVISVGTEEGAAVGQPVRTADGLVGRIVEVGRHSARVMLLTDSDSRVPVRNERTGRPAMVAGINDALLEVRFVAPSDGNPRIGDRLVTSGDGGIFSPGIPVAVVISVRGDMTLARPIAGAEALGYVIVEEPFLPLPTPAAANRASAVAVAPAPVPQP